MFKTLFRCIRRFFSRIKPKQRKGLQRRTEFGADIDIEEALAEELEAQRRSGRVLSSTASIAAALRQRPRQSIPEFSTHPISDSHDKASSYTMKKGVEMLSPTQCVGQTGDLSDSLVSAKSPLVGKRVPSSRVSTSAGSSFKIPESVPEDAEPEREIELKEKTSPTIEKSSEINPRRSSIFDMRSEWI
ncbi:hypothetical protein PsorP6_012306 [Peronosclerospora sorghi]|uniref:Uncharacterized protein n=1 Tax=Peronosclerospora sorghi TaxID=230839 RepID=A0ACC0WHT6_9STRA|nr:hypothetical protein PsorP6_012306 [Peronosclerospora sorghi]